MLGTLNLANQETLYIFTVVGLKLTFLMVELHAFSL